MINWYGYFVALLGRLCWICSVGPYLMDTPLTLCLGFRIKVQKVCVEVSWKNVLPMPCPRMSEMCVFVFSKFWPIYQTIMTFAKFLPINGCAFFGYLLIACCTSVRGSDRSTNPRLTQGKVWLSGVKFTAVVPTTLAIRGNNCAAVHLLHFVHQFVLIWSRLLFFPGVRKNPKIRGFYQMLGKWWRPLVNKAFWTKLITIWVHTLPSVRLE